MHVSIFLVEVGLKISRVCREGLSVLSPASPTFFEKLPKALFKASLVIFIEKFRKLTRQF